MNCHLKIGVGITLVAKKVELINYHYFFVLQILKTGFFHADPHPGNLAIDVDEAIIYYDFGMMGQIKSFTRERLLELFYAIYEKDSKKVWICTTLGLFKFITLSFTNKK